MVPLRERHPDPMKRTPPICHRLFNNGIAVALASLIMHLGIAVASDGNAPDLSGKPQTKKTSRPPSVDFAKQIRPILSDACYTCHGPDQEARSTELRLDSRESVLEADILGSGELLRRLLSDDPEIRMPPPESNRQLSPDDREQLKNWLKSGASWPENDQHWAFVPPTRPPVPNVGHTDWLQNPIDSFILSRLEQVGFPPSSAADKATLLRRVTFDLTGLPPTNEQLDRFLNDDSERAYEAAVDRLFASEKYGEHLSLNWLEASRYADTDGYQNDRLRYMWVWRDWLIQSLNENMPYDQFIIHQMAGDLIDDRNFRSQVATGFNRNHRINSEGGAIPDEWIVEYVADRVETMGTLFLGMTLNCSRCHDHKYDPISQRDFYSLFAYFNSIAEAGLGPNNGNSPPFIPVPKSWPNLSPKESKFIQPEPVKTTIVQTSVPRPQAGAPETVMVLHELPEPRETYRLIRGQYDQPDKSEKLNPSIPEFLGGWDPEWPSNRLGLARWLVSSSHPLTSRVTVNRFWQHFFGIGLVRTSENFGVQGDLPSHPELLDWLALEFIESGWDVKAFQKMIVMSATYRQSSVVDPELLEADPENRLLARGPRRRLSPFAIRDSALFTSGLLNERIGGPSVKPYMPPGIWKSISNAKYSQDHGDKLYRRSLYTYWRRTVPPPNMMAFNAAARETCSVRSDLTTTPLQALTLLNNITFIEAARTLAEAIIRPIDFTFEKKDRSNDSNHAAKDFSPATIDHLNRQLRSAFRSITSREPDAPEVELLLDDFHSYFDEFQTSPDRAVELLELGEKKRDASLNASAVAAMTLVANTLLNLDESMSQN